MTKVENEHILSKLEDPDISDKNIREYGSGRKNVHIQFSGSEANLKRLIGSDFDVLDTAPNDDGSIIAMLEPRIDSP